MTDSWLGSASDTKHYWKLTKHIFRYGHINNGDSFNGAHTVNEGASPLLPVDRINAADVSSDLCFFSPALRGEALIEAIRFFTWIILNADESPLLE